MSKEHSASPSQAFTANDFDFIALTTTVLRVVSECFHVRLWLKGQAMRYQYLGLGGILIGLACGAIVVSAPGTPDAGQSGATVARIRAVIGGQAFALEAVREEGAQELGMGGREAIGLREGMLFDFRIAEPQVFVMRDCSVPLDLLFVDERSVIDSVHSMLPEPPRGEGEQRGDAHGEAAYTARLRGYMSEGPARYAIEVRGGVIRELGLRPGHKVVLDGGSEMVETGK